MCDFRHRALTYKLARTENNSDKAVSKYCKCDVKLGPVHTCVILACGVCIGQFVIDKTNIAIALTQRCRTCVPGLIFKNNLLIDDHHVLFECPVLTVGKRCLFSALGCMGVP